ncbi:GntR family transcriptional regulator [Aldersonia kunmingensis]|uniref:GntR family transcriptional regulator n=1 Tax=Aldersonia kunmingensis TaxID=408066 RepID=UPI0008375411|nr:GntR family transcriptional regulator [Aldersonia kunmingensis]
MPASPGTPAETAAVSTARLSGARLSTVLYDVLKGRLLEGTYTAGERIVVEQIRREFDVSKQPVMDALRRLAADRLVAIIPQSGIEVLSYSHREVEDFFLLFSDFEATIAAVAAARRTEAQLAALARISAQVEDLLHSADPTARAHGYRVHNREFHATIHSMAHSRIMEETSQRMWDLSDFLINTAGIANPLSSALPQRQCDHEEIAAAIADKDEDRAREAMRQHIIGTVDIIDGERRSESA